MNFDLAEEQKDIIKAAREFAEREFPDLAQECDRKEEFPRHLWKKACELGFVGVFIPEAYGGAGLGFLEHCLINEEFWRVDPGMRVKRCLATEMRYFLFLLMTSSLPMTPPLPVFPLSPVLSLLSASRIAFFVSTRTVYLRYLGEDDPCE